VDKWGRILVVSSYTGGLYLNHNNKKGNIINLIIFSLCRGISLSTSIKKKGLVLFSYLLLLILL
jgi:hypothetical protein